MSDADDNVLLLGALASNADPLDTRAFMFHIPVDQCTLFDALQSSWERFSNKYKEYEPGAADETGLAGQWADLHRKVRKLKRAFWEGEEGYLTTEGEEEILDDLLGHVLLCKEMIARGMRGGRRA